MFALDGLELDAHQLDEPVTIARKTRDWLVPHQAKSVKAAPDEARQDGITVCVMLVSPTNERHLWVGEVLSRFYDEFVIQPWGVAGPLTFPLAAVLRSGPVPVHTSAEYREVARRQRQGLPARVYSPLGTHARRA